MVAQVVKNLLPKLYTVAAQKSKDSPLHVYKVRETDQDELLPFIKRVLEVESLTMCEFLEVHLQLPPGKGVAVIFGDSRRPWPRGVEVIHHETILSRNTRIGVQQGNVLPSNLPVPLTLDKVKIEGALVVRELFDKHIERIKPMKIKVA